MRSTSSTFCLTITSGGGALCAGAQRCRILRSTDGGKTWSFAPDSTGLVDAKLYALTSDARGRLYLGGGDQLLRSADGGVTWQSIGEGLDGAAVFDVASVGDTSVGDTSDGGGLLAATTWGVYRSRDDGLSWQPTVLLAP